MSCAAIMPLEFVLRLDTNQSRDRGLVLLMTQLFIGMLNPQRLHGLNREDVVPMV